MQWRIYVKNNLVPAGLMPLQADSVSVCALTNSDWNSCSVLLPCIQRLAGWLWKKLELCFREGTFFTADFVCQAGEGRQNILYRNEMFDHCDFTLGVLYTHEDSALCVRDMKNRRKSIGQSINQSCFVSVIDYTTQASFSLSPESDDWSSCHNATTPHHWQPWM